MHYLIKIKKIWFTTVKSFYREMCDTWFPETGNPPSAYLVDTSEEALLLPDWLKLRMIRSCNDRLVDAGKKSITH